ncbi:HD domain-containing protein [Candidatus Saccharibacteria bacterium]|nr:HD domain-containing protein [Candidatus Saccharibacteria bacterium]
MDKKEKIPTREEAEKMLAWAKMQNDGNWAEHSEVTARIAETIAKNCDLEPEKAYILGLLHDIGRYEGYQMGLRHITEGYRYLKKRGFDTAARVCLSHSFYTYLDPDDNFYIDQLKDEDDKKILRDFALKLRSGKAAFDEYDRLIQLADCMARNYGVVTINDRFVDIMLRYDFPDVRAQIAGIWRVKKYFDDKIGKNVYELFKKELSENIMREPTNVMEEGEK